MSSPKASLATMVVRLRVRGPVLVKSTAMGPPGVDAAVARRAGIPYLPGTLLAGKLREAWQEISGALDGTGDEGLGPTETEIGDWLGRGSDDTRRRDEEPGPASVGAGSQSFAPNRKNLVFTDLIASETVTKDETGRVSRAAVDADDSRKGRRTRIAVNERSGRTEERALQVMEEPFASGEEVFFEGTAVAFVADAAKADRLHRQLGFGLRWIPQIGSGRSAGLGQILSVSVERAHLSPVPNPSDLALPGPGPRYGLEICPLDPFCFTDSVPMQNQFEAVDHIPGGAIKGTIHSALASVLGTLTADGSATGAFGLLACHLELVRFTHAFPAQRHFLRPVRWPISLVRSGDDCLHDVALVTKPMLIGGRAPRFHRDWKNDADVWSRFGWARPKRKTRVRTAIASESRRHRSNALFAYETVDPATLPWYGYADLAQIPADDRQEVGRALAALLAPGLFGLSKTKARAKARLISVDELRAAVDGTLAPYNLPDGPTWAVTLQTPALLIPHEALIETATAETLQTAYTAEIAALSNGSLELSHYYAEQSLAGGDYLKGRFLDKTEDNKDGYRPYPLTAAGSVFVLRATPGKAEDAQAKIAEWFFSGLPLPAWALDRYRPAGSGSNPGEAGYWQLVPFLRQNGYGEIAVNLDVHADLYPNDAMKLASL